MKTLYFRIVVVFMLIALASVLLALLVSNLYAQNNLKNYNEQKIRNIGQEIVSLYGTFPDMDLDGYLTRVASMGFQIYAVDDRLKGKYYGGEFRHKKIDPAQIRRVLDGGTYHGISEKRYWLNIVGFFENSVQNSVGLPIQANGHPYALFIRPNLEQQFGDIRLLLAFLLGVTFVTSLLLIAIFSRYIVRPVQKLTVATNEIVRGNYDIAMDVARRDEIGNLARHFTQMAQSLKRLDDMRQEFVANVSHEIQSPLTSIQGFAQTMLSQEATAEEQERYLRIIEAESRRLSSLSQQLLTLAALDKDTNAIKATRFRLDEQIRQVIILTEWQWTEKRLSIDVSLPEIVVTGDAQLLHQVWLNLLTNSIKFSKPGGTIQISLTLERDVAVVFRDTGIGIAESELPRIFDRFYKADKARNRSRSGSGLGLAIVKKIVELHQGSVEARSKLGEGTSITVTLPHL